jgi:hypothetical protein
MKTASTVLLVWMVGSFTALAASPSSDFQAALDQARLNSQTNPGHDYELKVRMMIHKVLSEVIKECAGPQPHWDAEFQVAVIVAADGRVERILSDSKQALVVCAIKKARSQLRLPRPPRDSWPIVMGLAFQYWKN